MLKLCSYLQLNSAAFLHFQIHLFPRNCNLLYRSSLTVLKYRHLLTITLAITLTITPIPIPTITLAITLKIIRLANNQNKQIGIIAVIQYIRTHFSAIGGSIVNRQLQLLTNQRHLTILSNLRIDQPR